MVARNLKKEVLDSKNEGKSAPIIVRPSKLAEAGTTGVVAKGVYEKAEPNRFNKEKKDFFVRDEDGTLYIINSTQSLEEQFAQIDAGTGIKVEVQYAGKISTKSGRTMHDFTVMVPDTAEAKK